MLSYSGILEFDIYKRESEIIIPSQCLVATLNIYRKHPKNCSNILIRWVDEWKHNFFGIKFTFFNKIGRNYKMQDRKILELLTEIDKYFSLFSAVGNIIFTITVRQVCNSGLTFACMSNSRERRTIESNCFPCSSQFHVVRRTYASSTLSSSDTSSEWFRRIDCQP